MTQLLKQKNTSVSLFEQQLSLAIVYVATNTEFKGKSLFFFQTFTTTGKTKTISQLRDTVQPHNCPLKGNMLGSCCLSTG
jgi:hypothetical protein